MTRNRLGQLALLLLFVALPLTVAGCTTGASSAPTPTTWYLVVTNTPQPTSVPTSPTTDPAPTASPTASPAPTSTSTPMPTPPPIPTSAPTKAPTAPPPTSPPLPTAGPTSTPAPTVPAEDLCQGDEEMTFDPADPRVGSKFTIQVTSAKAHRNVRLDGPGKVNTPDKVQKGGKGYIWSWTIDVPREGKLTYTFYVENTTPCTSNKVTAKPPDTQPAIQLSCAKPDVKGDPGETVKIMVVMKNTGDAAGTFNVDIAKSAVPAGWQAMFCLKGVCYEDGPIAHSLAAGASDQIEVDIVVPDSVASGQKATVKVTVISQHDSSVKDTLNVSVTSK